MMMAWGRATLSLLLAFGLIALTSFWTMQPVTFASHSTTKNWIMQSAESNPTKAAPARTTHINESTGLLSLGVFDSLFHKSEVSFFHQPIVQLESHRITFKLNEAAYTQALAAHQNASNVSMRVRSKQDKKSFTYHIGKETARTAIVTEEIRGVDKPPTCDITVDHPVLIAPLIGVTFGENFYRTVLQAHITARAIESEFGIPLSQLRIWFHDPQRSSIVEGLRSVNKLIDSGPICDDPVRGNYNETSYTVALLNDPTSSFTYRPQAMRSECDDLLPQMPFLHHVGQQADLFNNEVFAYLELLGAGAVNSTHFFERQTICSTRSVFLSRPDYLLQWQSGQQEILHSPGMLDMVHMVQEQAGVIKDPTDPVTVVNGSYRAAVAGTMGGRSRPIHFALRSDHPTITLAARSCFPMLKPETKGACCNCKRVLLNENAIMQRIRDRFEPLGYVVQRAELSTLTARETVRLMANTTILLSAHSSALWNAVFLPANAAVIELYPGLYYEAMFQNFVRMTGKSYFKAKLPPQTLNGHHGHYIADINVVLRLLTLAHDVISNTETLRTYRTATLRDQN